MGHTIILITLITLITPIPQVRLIRNEVVIHSDTIHVDYHDLVPRLVTIKQWRAIQAKEKVSPLMTFITLVITL